MEKGTFITFEGGEGTGKTTQIGRLVGRLRHQGRTVLVAREPGGTEIGEQIRHVLLTSKDSAAMVPETEVLLFCASRAQNVREVIQPALHRGEVVIGDRFLDSTRVYQGVGRLLDGAAVETVNNLAIGNCLPDLTIVIDLDPVVGLERARGRELFDRMENQDIGFYQRVREGYLDLARDEPTRVKLVDGSQSIDDIEEQIWSLVRHVLP